MTAGGTKLITTDFILRNTEAISPPLIPELTLHLATEATQLWQATETELEQIGLPPPYWAFPWAGGQAVARYVIDNAPLVAGKRILDVGSGSGMVGLAALWASAAAVIANDTDPVAATAIALNAETNGLQAGLTIAIRDMLDEPVMADDGGPLYDTVLAGDICYERSMSDRMQAWLQRHADVGALVLVGDPGRTYQPIGGIALCAHYDVPVSLEIEDSELRKTAVWRLTGSAKAAAGPTPESP
ncbi:class I SAM-dependent methyltransferase [Nisaea denitrificans]|uniref:class I SAM-dependent methyltransferase n=1 Tax=Nisaea denitrificans TaxID=390877 RepID=UPI00040E17C1|nr:50S ribosomal protein L11 methyltransferase [Nisaea denitrificans]